MPASLAPPPAQIAGEGSDGEEEHRPLIQQHPIVSSTDASSASRDIEEGGCGGQAEGEEAAGTCRICFEGDEDPQDPLITPCHCAGSSRYIHRECLAQWRNTGHRRDASWQCEVCHFKYQFRRMWWSHLLGSKVTLILLFSITMFSACYLAGFVPLLQSNAPGWAVGSHMLNGSVMLGILGLVLSLFVLLSRSCSVGPAWLLLPDLPCALCMDGVPGLSLGECAGGLSAGAECGALLLVVLLIAGFLVSCYMAYALIWLGVKALLEGAVQMVENVAPLASARAAVGGGGGST